MSELSDLKKDVEDKQREYNISKFLLEKAEKRLKDFKKQLRDKK